MAPSTTEATLHIPSHVPNADGIQLFYRYSGEGPPLVWLHWLWGEPGWMEHHRRLAERFTVYVPDLPGYGESSLPNWVTSPADLAIVLLQFLDALSLKRPILAGSCIGGWIAAEMALLRPGSLGRLMLIDPLGLCIDWTATPNVFYAAPEQVPNFFFTAADLPSAQAYVPDRSEWSETFLQNRLTSSKLVFDPYLHSRTLAHRLHLLTTPTLVLWGGEDPLLGVEHAELWCSLISQARSTVISGGGHLPYVEKLDAVMDALVSFAPTETSGEKN